MGSIYTITHRDSGKVYVGQTWSLLRRWRQHRNDHRRRITPLNAAIAKYGVGAFDFDTITSNVGDQSTLDFMERFWIKIFDSTRRGVGYNLRKGGDGGGLQSDETKRKISESKKGNQIRLGAKLSDETKNKIAARARGRKAFPEARKKMSAVHTGKLFSAERRANISRGVKRYHAEKLTRETGQPGLTHLAPSTVGPEG